MHWPIALSLHLQDIFEKKFPSKNCRFLLMQGHLFNWNSKMGLSWSTFSWMKGEGCQLTLYFKKAWNALEEGSRVTTRDISKEGHVSCTVKPGWAHGAHPREIPENHFSQDGPQRSSFPCIPPKSVCSHEERSPESYRGGAESQTQTFSFVSRSCCTRPTLQAAVQALQPSR